jgi:hypothetical protein
VLGCGSKGKGPTLTREDCLRVADHTADMLMTYYTSHPDELWDGVHANPGDTELPAAVTKETFAAFLASPEAKPWLAKRHEQARSGLRNGDVIDRCAGHKSQKWLACMLATTSPNDTDSCDKQ